MQHNFLLITRLQLAPSQKETNMSALSITQQYFNLSNNRDLNNIFTLFAEDSTYSSDNTGLYFGVSDISQMMIRFYDSYPLLVWHIKTMEEITPYIVEVSFTLTMKDNNGEVIEKPGIERVVVVDQKLRHVEVRNSTPSSA